MGTSRRTTGGQSPPPRHKARASRPTTRSMGLTSIGLQATGYDRHANNPRGSANRVSHPRENMIPFRAGNRGIVRILVLKRFSCGVLWVQNAAATAPSFATSAGRSGSGCIVINRMANGLSAVRCASFGQHRGNGAMTISRGFCAVASAGCRITSATSTGIR